MTIEQIQAMRSILLRIGYPKRGTLDETKDIQDFADEIQDTFPLWELDDSYDGASK